MKKTNNKSSNTSRIQQWICLNILSYKFLIFISMVIIGEKLLVNSLLEVEVNLLNTTIDIIITETIIIPSLYVAIKGRNKYICEEESMKKMAFYDSLTGLPNRSLLSNYFKEVSEKNISDKEFTAVMFLDLDGFKKINDNLGHGVGDKILIALSKRLKNSVRDYDMVCRFGGDEFIILFPKVHKEENISTIAEKILKVFKNPFSIEGHELSVTSSIGVSLAPYDGKSLEELIKRADIAMYKCKGNGKNSYNMFSSKIEEKEPDMINEYLWS